jgi:mono/diheme cytochrome c family protein
MHFGLWMVAAGCTSGTPPLVTGDTGTSSTGQARVDTILPLIPTSTWQEGSDEYTQQCLVCHPADGGIGPNGEPALNELIPVRTNTFLVGVLLYGVVDVNGVVVMPDYAEYFTNQQIADLIAYMRVSFTPPY